MVGLLPDVFWSLTWPDYEDLLYNYRYREQQALVGPRMVATQVYNAMQGFAKTPRAKTAEQYLKLPLLDPPPVPPPTNDWWTKMEALAKQSGKRWPGPAAD